MLWFCDAARLHDRDTLRFILEARFLGDLISVVPAAKLRARESSGPWRCKTVGLWFCAAARLQGRDTAKPEILARIRNLRGSSSSVTRAGSAFASLRLSSCRHKLDISSVVTPGDFKLYDRTASLQKILQTYRAVVKPRYWHKKQYATLKGT